MTTDTLPPELAETRQLSELVAHVMKTFGQPLNEETRELYRTLIREEATEVRAALENLLKEMADLDWVAEAFMLCGGEATEAAEIVADIVEDGALTRAFNVFTPVTERVAVIRVYTSNMSKLGDDGKPIFREDGKYTKGPNYKPAVLTDLVSPAVTLN